MPGLIVPVIAVLLVVFGGVAFYVSRETRAETKRTGKYPKGHYMGRGMGAGIAIGAGIGIAMNTIAMILAGGEGTRLRPYTLTVPKPLLPLGQQPILEVVLRQLLLNRGSP